MASLSAIVGPTIDPVSIAEAKAACREDSADNDGLMAGYILSARQHCEDYTCRSFINRTLEQTFDYCWPAESGRLSITLMSPPAQSVSSITYIDTNGATQTLAANQYQFSKGHIHGRIVPAYGGSWPSVRAQLDCITVRYVAGYGPNPGNVPEPIRQAILLLTAHYYENREAVVINGAPVELPHGVRSLLSKYVTSGWA